MKTKLKLWRFIINSVNADPTPSPTRAGPIPLAFMFWVTNKLGTHSYIGWFGRGPCGYEERPTTAHRPANRPWSAVLFFSFPDPACRCVFGPELEKKKRQTAHLVVRSHLVISGNPKTTGPPKTADQRIPPTIRAGNHSDFLFQPSHAMPRAKAATRSPSPATRPPPTFTVLPHQSFPNRSRLLSSPAFPLRLPLLVVPLSLFLLFLNDRSLKTVVLRSR